MHEVCVIFNPASGKQRAAKRLEAVRQRWGERVEFRPTQHAGDAVILARTAAEEGFRTVAAAGGDGTVHEVANGLLQAQRPDVQFAVVPVGSANDFAFGLLKEPHDSPWAIDVGRARVENGRERYFVCNLGLGFNGAITLESRRIRWLQGIPLYGWATVRALCRHYEVPTMEITLDDAAVWSTPTLMFSLLLGKREGNFELAPQAELDDGQFDYIHASDLTRFQVLRFLPRVALWGLPQNHPQIRQGRCRSVRVRSPRPLNIHLDGEFLHRR